MTPKESNFEELLLQSSQVDVLSLQIESDMSSVIGALYSNVASDSYGNVLNLESASGVANFVKRLIIRIRDALVEMASLLSRFFMGLGSELGRLEFLNDRLAYNADERVGLSIRKKTIVGNRDAHIFMVHGKYPKSHGDYLSILSNLTHQYRVISDNYIPRAAQLGRDFMAIAADDKSTPTERFRNSVRAVEKLDLKLIEGRLSAKPYMDERFMADEMRIAPSLPSNKSLFIRSGNGNDTLPIPTKASLTRKLGVQLLPTITEYYTVDDVMLDTIPADIVRDMSARVTELLRLVADYERGSSRNDFIGLQRNLADVVKNIGTANFTPDDKANIAGMLTLLSGYTTWSSRPHKDMILLSLSVTRATISLGNKSLDAH